MCGNPAIDSGICSRAESLKESSKCDCGMLSDSGAGKLHRGEKKEAGTFATGLTPLIFNGRRDWSRTNDLYRVGVAL
jgi:hypothetical protein